MADVKVTQVHSISIEDAKAKIADFEEMMGKYGVKANWSGQHADLKGTGVKGSIDVSEQDVKIHLKLGMLAKAAGIDPKRLEGSISKRLKSAFETA